MYKLEQARQAIYKHDSSINTEWLDLLTVDTDRAEITTANNAQMTKSFIRGLIAVGAVSIEILDDVGL